MDSRRLTQGITIEAPSAAQDEVGQPVNTWSTVASLWADVRYLTGVEAIKAGAEAGTRKVSVRIRYRTGLTSGMRIRHGAMVYNIVAVLPDEQRRERVDLACEVVQ